MTRSSRARRLSVIVSPTRPDPPGGLQLDDEPETGGLLDGKAGRAPLNSLSAYGEDADPGDLSRRLGFSARLGRQHYGGARDRKVPPAQACLPLARRGNGLLVHARSGSRPFQSNSTPWPGRSGAIASPSRT